jgi:hypothetical protein
MNDQLWFAVFVAAAIILTFAVTMVPILLGFRYSRRKLELDHAERMRAIEVGQPVHRQGERQEEAWTEPARLAKAIGVVVPQGSLGCAFLASLFLGVHQEIWIAAGMVGLAGVVCGWLLAAQTVGANQTAHQGADLKPHVDEDAYDVVSARG